MPDKPRSVNDEPWAKIFEQLGVPQKVDIDGFATVSAKQIKTIGEREPRLMAKFDHASQQPKPFIDNGLSITATSRSDYAIGRFDLFQSLYTNELADSRRYEPLPWLESADYPNFTSEALTLNYAYSVGVIADLLGVDPENVKPTRSGRSTTGKWTFTHSTANGAHLTVPIDNAQIEIDGMYETPESLIIFEGKQGAPDDFNRRQLFYPMRTWRQRLPHKQIRTFYTDYLEGTYRFFEYSFPNLNDITSMELVSLTQYTNEENPITTVDIQELLQNSPSAEFNNGAPFPQADNFEKVLALLNELDSGPMTNEEIANQVVGNADIRQGDYYGNAIVYLGLGKRSTDPNTFELSEIGKRILSENNLQKRHLAIAAQIITHPPFHKTLESYLNNGNEPPKSQVADWIAQSTDLTGTTPGRRAGSVLNWVRWIIGTISDY